MKIVNAVEFDATTKKGVVLVDFSAEWCGPCKMIAPVLEQLSEELSGKVEIIKVDVDVEQQLAQKYNINGVIGADAHTFFEIGRNYMLVNIRPNSAINFLKATPKE